MLISATCVLLLVYLVYFYNADPYMKYSGVNVLCTVPTEILTKNGIYAPGNIWDRLRATFNTYFSSNTADSRRLCKRDYHIITLSPPMWGLGNLIFMYASVMGIAQKNELVPMIQANHPIAQIFHPKAAVHNNVIQRDKLQKLRGKYCCVYEEIGVKQDAELAGFFQSWKYFREIETRLREELTFKNHILKIASQVVNKQRHVFEGRNKSTVVGMHIRRGDAISQVALQYGFVQTNWTYIMRAMSYVKNKYKSVSFIACSDDPKWVLENIVPLGVKQCPGRDAATDMAILSLCDHVIITTGTFGWWSGWLSGGEVIYDSHWPRPDSRFDREVKHEDYFPPTWTGL